VYVKIIASCKGGTFFETQCRVSSLEIAPTTLATVFPPVIVNFDLWPWPSNLT